MSARINLRTARPDVVDELCSHLHIPQFIGATLAARGFDTLDKALHFLNPSLDRDWLNPYDIDQMQEAVDQLYQAIVDNKHILVFGDFDLDGISATSIMTRGLRAVGAQATPFIPLRFEEGYGLSEAAIKRALTYKPDLIITVDNGIACKNETPLLQEAGVDLIVTDHHEPSDLVPENVVVVDPKCTNNESSLLAGAGVALKVIQALGARFGKPHLWQSLIDLATLGTVADLMPMRDQNRALVAHGIEMIKKNPRPCVAALLAQAGCSDEDVSSTNLSFTIIPRLNAAGRMGNAQLALDLLMCDDYVESAALALELEKTNNRRRSIEAELADVAKEQAAQIYHGQRALVVAGEGWHEGVKGIVASRLVNIYGVPSILFTIDGDEAHGSGRSVGQVNLFKAVESCSDLLTRFGGHEAAVGVTLPTKNIDAFRERLCAYMDTLPADSFIPRITVDAKIDLGELTLANVGKLDILAPFGQENPTPRYLAHSVMLANGRAVGADNNHLSCQLTDGKHAVSGIMFHCSNIDELLAPATVLDAVFEVQIDEWKGRRSVKAMISSLTSVEPCCALEACLCEEDHQFITNLFDDFDEETWTTSLHEVEEEIDRLDGRDYWQEVAKRDVDRLRREVVKAFIGDNDLHDAQKAILDQLDRNTSVFSVMGTGRGKSLIFYIHAVELVLVHQRPSLFIYPLRALIADQAFHLQEKLRDFGIAVAVLDGSCNQEQRRVVMQALGRKEVDIVLTTPEYLDAHCEDLSQTTSFGFVVVDEAHHVALSRAGYRPAYRRLSEAVALLGAPPVLALTATADEAVAHHIMDAFNITRHVFDETPRLNLTIDDQRNIKKRERYLTNLVSAGEKTIIYVNSRYESIALARELRKHVPHIASLIGFYNAGLARDERAYVEEMFRVGELQILVATSAFGEGIDIPGIRHVILYHLPFSEVEFNQMSGRAGRDGHEATIHLLFGREDADINRSLLNSATPNHDDMAQIYRSLRACQRKSDTDYFLVDPQEFAKQISAPFPASSITPSQIQCGLTVFEELGLIKTKHTPAKTESCCMVCVVDYKGKVELVDSVRYREGLDEIDSFISFKEWVLSSSATDLQNRIRKPLLP